VSAGIRARCSGHAVLLFATCEVGARSGAPGGRLQGPNHAGHGSALGHRQPADTPDERNSRDQRKNTPPDAHARIPRRTARPGGHLLVRRGDEAGDARVRCAVDALIRRASYRPGWDTLIG
jgi:hypothetical protein